TSSPPGASTRAISSSAFAPSSKCSIAQIDITRSKLASANGRFSASPSTSAGALVSWRPRLSLAPARSSATARAPRFRVWPAPALARLAVRRRHEKRVGSAGGDGVGVAGFEGFEVGDGLVEGAHLDQAQARGHGALGVRAVGGGGQEDGRASVARAGNLLLDAADGLHLSAGGDLPGPGDEPARGQVELGE